MLKFLFIFLPFVALSQVNNDLLNKEFVKLLNTYRAQNDLAPVILDDASIHRAKLQTNHCINIEDLTHDCPVWFPSRWAECILWDSDTSSAQDCLNQWIESPPHNELLLLDGATRIGIWGGLGRLDDWDGFYATLVIN